MGNFWLLRLSRTKARKKLSLFSIRVASIGGVNWYVALKRPQNDSNFAYLNSQISLISFRLLSFILCSSCSLVSFFSCLRNSFFPITACKFSSLENFPPLGRQKLGYLSILVMSPFREKSCYPSLPLKWFLAKTLHLNDAFFIILHNKSTNCQTSIAHISATVRARTPIFWYVVEESILGKKWLWFAVGSFP